MKKLITLFLCLSLVATLLAGCGPTGTNSGGNAGDNGDGQTTITIGLLEDVNVQDYETNAFTLWLEEQSGYNIEFYYYAASANDAKSQVSTMVAIGEDLPDIVFNVPLGDGVIQEFGEDEYIIDLKPYFEDKEKSKVFWERMAELPEDYQETILRTITDKKTGSMYAFPHAEYTVIDTMAYQVYINQEWLDALNLEMPTDTDSLYNVLKAFLEQDPNGNGQADEIPLIGAGLSGNTINWLINMFTYLGDHTWNVDSDGQLYLPQTTDEYREALKYINKLVKDGLLPDSVFSMSWTDVKGLLNQPDGVEKVGIFVAHPTLVGDMTNDALYAYEALPYWGCAAMSDNQLSRKTYISAGCENPDAAWEILMLMCSKEGSYRMRYGDKGTDWVEADEGATSYLGLPAEIKVLNEAQATSQGNESWKEISATIMNNAENEASQLDDNTDDWTKKKLQIMADCYEYYQAAQENNPDVLCPKLIYSLEESEMTVNERSNCSSYLSQMRSNFCIGINDPSNDTQWAEYLTELESLGLEAWRSQAQSIYEAQIAE